MEKIITFLLVVFLTVPTYAGTVTIIRPLSHKNKINAVPEAFQRKVSLVGDNLKLQTAFGMLARVTGIPIIVIHSSNVINNSNDYYFIHKPLYMILNSLIIDNGYAYKYKNGEIYVYGLISRIFHLPINNLNYSFSASTGMAGMSGVAQTGTGSPSMSSAVPAAGGGEGTSPGSLNPISSVSGSGNSSNPGGNIGGSMTLDKTDLYYIRKTLESMLSKHGELTINPVLGLVYVNDAPANVKKIGFYINTVKKNMIIAVYLKVKVLVVALNKTNQYGINWNMVFNQAFKSNVLGMGTITIGANLANGAGISSGTPSIELSNASGSNNVLLTALSSQGKVNVISSPTLMLLNGETRSISDSSISSYVQSVMTTTNGLTSSSTYPVISQIQTGISISFTPHINDKTGIITVTVNFLDNDITGYNNFNIGGNSFENPIIDSKTLTDTIRVKSNHTAIMGGIFTASDSNQNYGVPVLSSIPILGRLFEGTNDTTGKSDLVIMITPKIVRL